MAFDDQQPPWGQKKRPPTPEEMIASLIKNLKDAFGGGGGATRPPGTGGAARGPGFLAGLGKVGGIIAALVIFNIVYSSFYTINPGERGVVVRFGKYTKTADPGLNFKVPLIDTVYKVNVDAVRKEEFGFRTREPGQKTVYQKNGFDSESLMLTGDKNVIDVEWIVQYKVLDPVRFVFKVADVQAAVRDVSESVSRRIVGNMDFDYVLSNREILAAATAREVQNILDRYETGVKIVTVQLQDVNPPEEVKPAFNEVNEADQDMKRLVNEAEEAYNKVVPKARGQAKETIEEAHGYAVERVNGAKGDASRFLAVLKEYQGAKDVTRRRMYLETMQKVLPQVSEVYVIDKEQRSVLPFLDLAGAKKK
ncbi:MAG: FtsH protease activity modulator HflK [Desulfobulbaceae bacterium]|nr:FtsH protease activity modulator HflK [Desulfobulbaceae bacterium]